MYLIVLMGSEVAMGLISSDLWLSYPILRASRSALLILIIGQIRPDLQLPVGVEVGHWAKSATLQFFLLQLPILLFIFLLLLQ